MSELLAAWEMARHAIREAVAAHPEGADPEHLAQLRMQEIRAWRDLQNAAALDALHTAGKVKL
ncbi:hypothetical protein MHZ93_17975 [Roseomonas sp. ACRSG]|uniref:Uncharacterized protein n=1 Tax=Pseudoroseomonas ludipueritiae TaxID=198093 RepID=A0ABR7R814_9PROT|nr:hypothetical protein [Pseudoroseomonas ludipueritiae]MCG7363151.1 hypothetical protein [Roseomonas sp. ACRSG]